MTGAARPPARAGVPPRAAARAGLHRRAAACGRRAVPRALALALAVTAGTAAVVLPAGPARADHVRDQESWVLDAIGAPGAWAQTRGHGVTVAVIDSGVNPHVSDLAGSVTEGPDLTGVHTPPSNPDWGTHGTWMATLIAGHGHGPGDTSGIMGAAPQARILGIRVVTDSGDPGYAAYQDEPDTRVQQSLATAIRYATGRHAGVISMSLGYGAPSREVREALQAALDRGVVVVASAGNSGARASARAHGQAPYSFPADYPGVLGVGAVTQTGTTAGFSSANLSVQVAAPGVMVPTQGRDGKYWYVNGTSPACALTAGVAALIRSKYPGLPPALVDQAITASAQDRPPGGYDDKVGFGTVDATAALTVAAHLLRATGGRHGVSTAAHFGGGAAAVAAPPVGPRDRMALLWYILLAVIALAVTAVTGQRLARLRRLRPAGTAAGDDHDAAAGARGRYPGYPVVPQPSRPPPDRTASYGTAADQGGVTARRYAAPGAGRSAGRGGTGRGGAGRGWPEDSGRSGDGWAGDDWDRDEGWADDRAPGGRSAPAERDDWPANRDGRAGSRAGRAGNRDDRAVSRNGWSQPDGWPEEDGWQDRGERGRAGRPPRGNGRRRPPAPGNGRGYRPVSGQ
jgi:hypothetical protein